MARNKLCQTVKLINHRYDIRDKLEEHRVVTKALWPVDWERQFWDAWPCELEAEYQKRSKIDMGHPYGDCVRPWRADMFPYLETAMTDKRQDDDTMHEVSDPWQCYTAPFIVKQGAGCKFLEDGIPIIWAGASVHENLRLCSACEPQLLSKIEINLQRFVETFDARRTRYIKRLMVSSNSQEMIHK